MMKNLSGPVFRIMQIFHAIAWLLHKTEAYLMRWKRDCPGGETATMNPYQSRQVLFPFRKEEIRLAIFLKILQIVGPGKYLLIVGMALRFSG